MIFEVVVTNVITFICLIGGFIFFKMGTKIFSAAEGYEKVDKKKKEKRTNR